MEISGNPARQIRYAVYDRKSGKLLSTYSRLDAVKNVYVEVPTDELTRELAMHTSILSGLTDKDPANLGIIPIDPTQATNTRAHMVVDLKSMKLVALPKLHLTANNTELVGDGVDTVTIDVQAVDEQGRPVRDLEGAVRVTTERGKLSERGGLMKLVRGHGKIKLTSANETVRRVLVRAESPDGSAARGELRLEFV